MAGEFSNLQDSRTNKLATLSFRHKELSETKASYFPRPGATPTIATTNFISNNKQMGEKPTDFYFLKSVFFMYNTVFPNFIHDFLLPHIFSREYFTEI